MTCPACRMPPGRHAKNCEQRPRRIAWDQLMMDHEARVRAFNQALERAGFPVQRQVFPMTAVQQRPVRGDAFHVHRARTRERIALGEFVTLNPQGEVVPLLQVGGNAVVGVATEVAHEVTALGAAVTYVTFETAAAR